MFKVRWDEKTNGVILTDKGVDAAHIIPWRVSTNDDIRNGMALCKLCHWAFDEGMLGVSGNYNVITSKQIGADPNVPGFLLTLSGRSIIPPAERDFWPDAGIFELAQKRVLFVIT